MSRIKFSGFGGAWLVCVGLSGCVSGFVVQAPPSNQFLTARNTAVTPASLPSTRVPMPTPVLPAASAASLGIKAAPLSTGRGVKPLAAGVPVEADVNAAPFDSFTRLAAVHPDNPNVSSICTAEFVGDSKDVLLTAAHCVFNNDSKRWYTSFSAAQKYRDGISPQTFGWQCAAIYSGWAYGEYARDYAFIKVIGKSATALGLRAGNLPGSFRAAGYPQNFQSNERLMVVDGGSGPVGNGVVQMADNPMRHGNSGGAWLDGNVAIGLNSFAYDSDAVNIWGPRFDSETLRLYEYVRRNCSDEVQVAATSSSKTSQQAIAPALTLSDSEECSSACKGAQQWTFLNGTGRRYLVQLRENWFGPAPSQVLRELNQTETLPGEARALKCSIQKDDAGACRVSYRPTIVSSSRISSFVDFTGQKKIESASPTFCSAMCASDAPTGYCLGLGTSAVPIVQALSGFAGQTLDAGQDGEVTTIPQLVKSFNGDPSQVGNPCARSSFFRTAGIVLNDGQDCKVTTAPLGTSPTALKISLSTPTQARAKKVAVTSGPSIASFAERDLAPTVEFTGPANSADLNANFGGKVLAVQVVDDKTIITTENGCLAGSQK